MKQTMEKEGSHGSDGKEMWLTFAKSFGKLYTSNQPYNPEK